MICENLLYYLSCLIKINSTAYSYYVATNKQMLNATFDLFQQNYLTFCAAKLVACSTVVQISRKT